ncbi:FecR domain-containing protein [Salisediminibacterium beveridgei]|uniref:Fibronectin Type III Domain-Containing Protein n=1 Tax=Salisediminibacterium beveridgei TaxID=632773 RepID=A0A1D7QYB3_9BACI|nr:FecR domain-containing protein [Salisediminibacterium beveridgei]AOM83995.1 Fibronectin Type III Domain-Containing Protein [Salisediminibacterium beveridgei]
MKSKLIVISALLFHSFFMFPVFPLNQVDAATSEPQARLAEVEGDVFVRRGGGLAEYEGFNGMGLFDGDEIRTSDDGALRVEFDSEDATTIDHHSKVMVTAKQEDDGEQSTVKLWTGKVWNKVKRVMNIDDSYDVETPTTVMGVRGTLYYSTHAPEESASDTTVIDGSVEVSMNRLIPTDEEDPVQEIGPIESHSQSVEDEKLNEGNDPDINEMTDDMGDLMVTDAIFDIIETTRETDMERDLDEADIDGLFESLDERLRSYNLSEVFNQMVDRLDSTERVTEISERIEQRNERLEEMREESLDRSNRTRERVSDTLNRLRDLGLTDEEIDSRFEEQRRRPEEFELQGTAEETEGPSDTQPASPEGSSPDPAEPTSPAPSAATVPTQPVAPSPEDEEEEEDEPAFVTDPDEDEETSDPESTEEEDETSEPDPPEEEDPFAGVFDFLNTVIAYDMSVWLDWSDITDEADYDELYLYIDDERETENLTESGTWLPIEREFNEDTSFVLKGYTGEQLRVESEVETPQIIFPGEFGYDEENSTITSDTAELILNESYSPEAFDVRVSDMDGSEVNEDNLSFDGDTVSVNNLEAETMYQVELIARNGEFTETEVFDFTTDTPPVETIDFLDTVIAYDMSVWLDWSDITDEADYDELYLYIDDERETEDLTESGTWLPIEREFNEDTSFVLKGYTGEQLRVESEVETPQIIFPGEFGYDEENSTITSDTAELILNESYSPEAFDVRVSDMDGSEVNEDNVSFDGDTVSVNNLEAETMYQVELIARNGEFSETEVFDFTTDAPPVETIDFLDTVIAYDMSVWLDWSDITDEADFDELYLYIDDERESDDLTESGTWLPIEREFNEDTSFVLKGYSGDQLRVESEVETPQIIFPGEFGYDEENSTITSDTAELILNESYSPEAFDVRVSDMDGSEVNEDNVSFDGDTVSVNNLEAETMYQVELIARNDEFTETEVFDFTTDAPPVETIGYLDTVIAYDMSVWLDWSDITDEADYDELYLYIDDERETEDLTESGAWFPIEREFNEDTSFVLKGYTGERQRIESEMATPEIIFWGSFGYDMINSSINTETAGLILNETYPPEAFDVTVTEVGGEEISEDNFNFEGDTLSINGLTPETMYEVELIARNGEFSETEVFDFTTDAPPVETIDFLDTVIAYDMSFWVDWSDITDEADYDELYLYIDDERETEDLTESGAWLPIEREFNEDTSFVLKGYSGEQLRVESEIETPQIIFPGSFTYDSEEGNITSDTAELILNESYSPEAFDVTVTEVDGEEISEDNFNFDGDTLSINGLTPETMYEVELIARNGEFSETEVFDFTTDAPPVETIDFLDTVIAYDMSVWLDWSDITDEVDYDELYLYIDDERESDNLTESGTWLSFEREFNEDTEFSLRGYSGEQLRVESEIETPELILFSSFNYDMDNSSITSVTADLELTETYQTDAFNVRVENLDTGEEVSEDNVTFEGDTIFINDLTPGTMYQVELIARNGEFSETEVFDFTTEQDIDFEPQTFSFVDAGITDQENQESVDEELEVEDSDQKPADVSSVEESELKKDKADNSSEQEQVKKDDEYTEETDFEDVKTENDSSSDEVTEEKDNSKDKSQEEEASPEDTKKEDTAVDKEFDKEKEENTEQNKLEKNEEEEKESDENIDQEEIRDEEQDNEDDEEAGEDDEND